MSRAYAEVIGDPIAPSKSPLIHNFWLGNLGIDAEYRSCHVKPEELADYFTRRRVDAEWRGCNVTMPHKQAVMPLLDVIDPLAIRIGAVNTVVRSADGLLTGYNTDASGFLEPLSALLAQPSLYRMARIFGAGGAARAIVVALADAGFTLVLAARDLAKAQALLDELAPGREDHSVEIANFSKTTDFVFDDRAGILDLIVNASPLGMAGHPSLDLDFSHVPPGSIFYDIVTHPVETPLLAEAHSRGFQTIDGLAMLIGQAHEAFSKFFGEPATRQHDAELRAGLTA